jgi:hypothetical protein
LSIDGRRSHSLPAAPALTSRQRDQPLVGQSIENVSDRYVFKLAGRGAPIPMLC